MKKEALLAKLKMIQNQLENLERQVKERINNEEKSLVKEMNQEERALVKKMSYLELEKARTKVKQYEVS